MDKYKAIFRIEPLKKHRAESFRTCLWLANPCRNHPDGEPSHDQWNPEYLVPIRIFCILVSWTPSSNQVLPSKFIQNKLRVNRLWITLMSGRIRLVVWLDEFEKQLSTSLFKQSHQRRHDGFSLVGRNLYTINDSLATKSEHYTLLILPSRKTNEPSIWRNSMYLVTSVW